MSHNVTPEEQKRLINTEISRGAPVSLTNPIPVTNVTGNTVYMGGPNPLPTQDTGVNTNPRRYETDNAFRSQVLTLNDALAHPLYTLTTTPARTAGESVFIYKIRVFNRGGGVGSVQLEQPVGTVISLPVACDDKSTVNESFPTPLPVGTTGVWARAGITVTDIDVQIIGLEV